MKLGVVTHASLTHIRAVPRMSLVDALRTKNARKIKENTVAVPMERVVTGMMTMMMMITMAMSFHELMTLATISKMAGTPELITIVGLGGIAAAMML